MAGLANLGVLGNGFAYDDVRVIELLRQHQITLASGSAVTPEPGVAATPPLRDQELRPLTYAVHLLNYQLWGDAPFGFHLSSLLLHMVATALVYAAALLFVRTAATAALVALLFAVHPLHVEVVASFANVKDILALIFDLSALLAWVRIRPHVPRVLTTGALLALGFVSKEIAVVGLPVLLMAGHGVLGPDREEAKPARWQVRVLLFLAIGLGAMVAAGLLWGDRIPGFNPADIGNATEQQLHHYSTVLANAALGVLRLVRLLVLPIGLSADYPVATNVTLASPAVWLALSTLAALIVLPLMGYRRRPRAALAAAWVIVMYLPISNLIPLVHFFAADRYAYVPSFGYCVLFGMATDFLHRRAGIQGRRAIVAVVVLVMGLLALQTARRVGDWKNDLSLWSSASRAGYETYRIRHKLGVALFLASDANADTAATELSRAIALRPGITEDHLWLAGAFFAAHRAEDAWREANTVLQADSANAICRFIRGELLLQRGDSLRALADYRVTVASDSTHFGALMRIAMIDLAQARARPGGLEEAAALARRAARLTTNDNAAFHQQAVELVRQSEAAIQRRRK